MQNTENENESINTYLPVAVYALILSVALRSSAGYPFVCLFCFCKLLLTQNLFAVYHRICF